MSDNNDLRYRRSRFSTRLPLDRVYSPAHFWLREIGPRTYEVGYTRFATRMLGDFVEMAFEVTPGMKITRGQTIGWIEGFKAASDLISAADGTFLGTNPTLEADITTIESDTYGSGSKIFRVQIEGWCGEFETRNAADSTPGTEGSR